MVLEPGLPRDIEVYRHRFSKRELSRALMLLLYHLGPERCTPMVLPASVSLLLSLIPHLLSALAGASQFFSFLPPNSFQFVSPLTSAFKGRVGTVLSAGAVAEAILLRPHIPIQGHACTPTSPAWWHGGAGREGA